VELWQELPWQYGLLIILGVIVAVFLASLTEAGPFRISTLARRFSWAGIPICTILVWWCWCAFLFMRTPYISTNAVLNSSFVLIGLLYWCAFLYFVLLRNHLHKGIVKTAYRRMRFRLRWDSIARSCGMAHERDVRPHGYVFGGTTIKRQSALIVQWTPVLWHGRRGESGNITHYLVRPTRGLSDETWTDPRVGEGKTQLEKAIALAAMASLATLSKGTEARNWFTLTLFWNDVESYRDKDYGRDSHLQYGNSH
jgi:hypothetical protein